MTGCAFGAPWIANRVCERSLRLPDARSPSLFSDGARQHRNQSRQPARPGQRLQRLGRVLRLRARAARVDQRRFARHGNRFFDRAELQLGVHGGREFRPQLDARASERVEAGQREGDRVRARSQIDDPIYALARRSRRRGPSRSSAGLAASTVTPGSTAPEVSRTTPAMLLCAQRHDGSRTTNDTTTNNPARQRPMGSPL